MAEKHFDIIFLGSGMSNCSLLYRALKMGLWADKKIAVIDKQHTNKQEKTWCFWENKQGPFESILYKQWENFNFYSHGIGNKQLLDNNDYNYKMLRSSDFYEHCYKYFESQSNISIIENTINQYHSDKQKAFVNCDGAIYSAELLFNSLYVKPELKSKENYFLQHFKGWFIESKSNVFDVNSIHFMDFRPSQKHGCTFMYVLPLSEKRALVEYTLFTKTLLNDPEYNTALKKYISQTLNISEYTISHEEFGIIPMTDHLFTRRNGNIINLGSAGGDTRASTGYTFQNTQKTITHIINHYKKNGINTFPSLPKNKKENLLDSTFLKVFEEGKYPPHKIFSDLFTNCDVKKIFRFLDGESKAIDDIAVMKSLEAKYFILPFFKSIFQ